MGVVESGCGGDSASLLGESLVRWNRNKIYSAMDEEPFFPSIYYMAFFTSNAKRIRAPV